MSRSALWRQEGNRKERERQADELFNLAVEEGRNNRSKGLVPTWGPDDSFHLNPMLLQNIIKSPYFQKCCRDITDWTTLVDEIYYEVKHLEPWAVGSSRDPSTAFCLLLRLFTLRCTEKQMKLLLDHVDSPYIRGIGFLYLRYVCDPKVVWDWIEPYLYDEEVVQVAASAKQPSETMGSFVRRLFTDRNYAGTMLPRLPIQIERDVQVKLLQAEKIEERAQKHIANDRTMEYFQKLGAKVMALYGDEENPTQWYEGVVDRVITTNEDTGLPLKKPKFIVTFPEYGNTETVTLGEMEMPGMAAGLLEKPRYEDPADREHRAKEGGREERGYENHSRGYGKRDYDLSDDRGYRDRQNERGYGGRNSGRGYGTNSKTSDRGYGGRDSGRGYGNYNKDRDYSDRSDSYSRDRDHSGRGRYDDRWERGYSGNSRSSHTASASAALPTEDDLYEEVRRRERETVTANNRNQVSRRPPSLKSQLGSYPDGNRRSASPEDVSSQVKTREQQPAKTTSNEPVSETRKRTPEEIAAIQDKKRRLMAKYG